MFTGLIETMGTVAHLQKLPGGARITIRVPQFAAQLELGDSISVNGCCVTVVEQEGSTFTADLVPESLARTNLGVLAIGSTVNLERALPVGSRFGGHWVQGHVDCLGQVRSRKRVGNEELLEITIPFEISRYIVAQGSISLDGVSLTVVDVGRDRFRVALIPHTRELTTLGRVQPMDVVNVEIDVIAKYVEKHVAAFAQRLPRMIREATPPTGATAPGPLTSRQTPEASGSGSGDAGAQANGGLKRDRPKVRRSAQPLPPKTPEPTPRAETKPAAASGGKSASRKTAAPAAKAAPKPGKTPVRAPATTKDSPAKGKTTGAKRTAASEKPRPRTTAAAATTAKKTARPSAKGKAASTRTGRR